MSHGRVEMSKVKCDCKVGTGKFMGEGPLAFMAFQHVMLGGADDTTFDEEDQDLATDWFKAPFNFDTDGADVLAKKYGYCDGCIAEALANESYGLSLFEDSYGFVYLAQYATEEEYWAAREGPVVTPRPD
jgi:hypothetical protein